MNRQKLIKYRRELLILGLPFLMGAYVVATGRARVTISSITATPTQGTLAAQVETATYSPTKTPTQTQTITPSPTSTFTPLPSDTPTITPNPAISPTPTPYPPIPQRKPEATPFGGGTGVISFVSDRDGNGEIYRMNADGTALTRLTFGEADDSRPSWSYDGEWIAFMSWRDGFPDIHIMRQNGSMRQKLTTDPGYDEFPMWSPDGEWIIFDSMAQG